MPLSFMYVDILRRFQAISLLFTICGLNEVISNIYIYPYIYIYIHIYIYIYIHIYNISNT